MKKKIIIILSIILILILGLFLAIRPVKTLETSPIDEASLTEMVGEKIVASAMEMFTNGTDGLQIKLSEDELNGIIVAAMKENKDISGLHCIVNEDEIVFYVDLKLGGILPTQLIIHTNLTMIEKELNIELLKVSIGRLPIPRSIILEQLESKMENGTINKKENSIALPIDLPEASSIENLIIEENHIIFQLKISIDSITDVLSLFEFFEKEE